MTADELQMFGRFKIASSQIFYRSKYSFAMVNLRPLVPGHVLVVSNRIVPLLSDLDCEFFYYYVSPIFVELYQDILTDTGMQQLDISFVLLLLFDS